MNRQANGRIRICNQGALHPDSVLSTAMPAHRPAKSKKNRKPSLRPSSKSDWMVIF